VPGLAFPFGILFPLGVVGLAVGARRAPLLAWIVLVYALAVLAFFITARYRVPLVPFLLIFAAEGVRWFVRDAGPRARIAAGASAILLYAVSNAGQGPMPAVMNADAEYSLAVKDMMKGRTQDAEILFRSALAKNRDYPEAWVNLGVLEATRGHLAEADRLMREALVQDPQNLLALTNLGVVREKLGDRAGALDLYRRALAIDPRDPFANDKVTKLQAPQTPGSKPQ
jgi:tetratricopeptide (TPR) repeat protein